MAQRLEYLVHERSERVDELNALLEQAAGPPCPLDPMLEGPCADSEEKHEPASDADAAVVDSLKALDLNRPIREADMPGNPR